MRRKKNRMRSKNETSILGGRTREKAPIVLFSVILAFSLTLFAQPQPKTTLKEVSEKLSCRCGCNLVLSACNHINCGSAIPLRAEVEERIKLGMSRDEIIEDFVKRYGTIILAEPPKTGFNLSAWVLPFATLFVGGLAVVYFIRVMLRRKVATAPASAGSEMPSYTARIEEELKKFEE